MATWDNSRATTPAAPILLRQASVGRHLGTAEDFDLGVSGPWSLNTTLLRLLEIDFGVDVDVEGRALADLVEELPRHGDPDAVFERMTKMAAAVPGFSIVPRVVLAPVPRAVMVVDRTLARYPDPDLAHPPEGVAAQTTETAPSTETPLPSETTRPTETTLPGASVEATTVARVQASTVDRIQASKVDAADTVEPDAVSAVETSTDGTVETTTVEVTAPDAGDRTIDALENRRVDQADAPSNGGGPLDQIGPDEVIAEIAAALEVDHWPETLIEHMACGLRVRSGLELLERWYDARDQSSGWDATHFALWGLTAAPTSGIPAIQALRQWGARRHHPVLVAWQVVAERRLRRNHIWPGHKLSLRPHRLATPKGIGTALWGLPVDLLVEWSSWVFRQWPGAPMELLLPAGTADLVTPWYERARPVAELAVRTWVQASPNDDELARAAHRWVKDLANACAGAGEPLAVWFEKSRVAASVSMGRRVGLTVPPRGRPPYGGDTEAHQHAI